MNKDGGALPRVASYHYDPRVLICKMLKLCHSNLLQGANLFVYFCIIQIIRTDDDYCKVVEMFVFKKYLTSVTCIV